MSSTDKANLSPRRAFTVVEMLVAISIIGILVALLVPGAGRLIDQANQTKCSGNLRQLHTALVSYAADNKGFFPIALDERDGSSPWLTYLNSGGYLPGFVKDTMTPSRYFMYCPSSTVRSKNKAEAIRGNYGINMSIAGRNRINGKDNPRVPVSAIVSPSKKFLLMDAGGYMVQAGQETGGDGELMYIPGLAANQNITWIERCEKDAVEGRHRGTINVLMVDGHVEPFFSASFSGSTSWSGTN